MNKMYLTLGDYSNDGHGRTESVLIECNHTVEEVRQAYKDSCKLTGISFNHNDDFTGIERGYNEANKYRICVGYEKQSISNECIKVLEKFNCPYVETMKNEYDDTISYYIGDCFVELWLWFVKLSIPDFEYKLITDSYPEINGWSGLSCQFGYGLY